MENATPAWCRVFLLRVKVNCFQNDRGFIGFGTAIFADNFLTAGRGFRGFLADATDP